MQHCDLFLGLQLVGQLGSEAAERRRILGSTIAQQDPVDRASFAFGDNNRTGRFLGNFYRV